MCFELKFSESETKKATRFAKNTIGLWRNRFLQTGEMKRQEGSGRPRSTTLREDRLIKRRCLQDRRLSAIDIRRTLRARDDKPLASVWTVRRRLVAAGLRARIPVKKPLLTQYHKNMRLEWAKKYKNWTVEQWSKVLWSDESPFPLFYGRRRYVRRGVGERLRDDCLNKTVKFGGGKSIFGDVFMRRVLVCSERLRG